LNPASQSLLGHHPAGLNPYLSIVKEIAKSKHEKIMVYQTEELIVVDGKKILAKFTNVDGSDIGENKIMNIINLFDMRWDSVPVGTFVRIKKFFIDVTSNGSTALADLLQRKYGSRTLTDCVLYTKKYTPSESGANEVDITYTCVGHGCSFVLPIFLADGTKFQPIRELPNEQIVWPTDEKVVEPKILETIEI